MDIYKSLEITESMNKQQILDKIFTARKKCVTKQNSANPEKRSEAETLLEVINDLEGLLEFLPESFSQTHLVVKTYQFDYQHEATADHSVRTMKDSVNGDFDAVCRLTGMLREYTQWELSSKWYYYFITRRNVKAYEPYGQDLLFMAETKEGIKWLEKAYDENCISEVGLYNLGISYFGQTSYTKALRYFEEAYENGYRQGLHHVAWMYENGNGTNVDLEAALEWYERAQQYEGYDATEDTRRIRSALATMAENGSVVPKQPEDNRNPIQKFIQEQKKWLIYAALFLVLIIVFLLNKDKFFKSEKNTEVEQTVSSEVDSSVTTRTEYFRINLSDAKISYKQPVEMASLVTLDANKSQVESDDVAMLTDNGIRTYWKSSDNGIGTEFHISLAKTTNLHWLMIYNGNRDSKDDFEANNRIKTVEITVKGESRKLDLPDLIAGQTIELVDCSNVSEITIRVDDVYPGNTNDNLCVSEIVVY